METDMQVAMNQGTPFFSWTGLAFTIVVATGLHAT